MCLLDKKEKNVYWALKTLVAMMQLHKSNFMLAITRLAVARDFSSHEAATRYITVTIETLVVMKQIVGTNLGDSGSI